MKEQTTEVVPIPVIAEPAAPGWNVDTVYRQINNGAFSIILFLAIVFWFTKKSMSDSWHQLKELIANMTSVNLQNAESLKEVSDTLQKNAESLSRLSKANSAVAKVMASEVPDASRKQKVLEALSNPDDDMPTDEPIVS